MPEVDRRRFLQLTGGSAALSVLTPSIARAASIPANRRTGSINDVEHIVVLMQENRSFDHYFGTMRGVRGFGDPHPVHAAATARPSGASRTGRRTSCRSAPTLDDLGPAVPPGPRPRAGTTRTRRSNGGNYDQWVPAKARRPRWPT